VLNIGVLKRTLSPDQPLYAVRIVPHRFRYGSIEEIAREYLGEIQAAHPSGPYFIASICSGSAIVAELARVGRDSGVDIALAAVIDPRPDLGKGPVRHYLHQAFVHLQDGTLSFAVRRKFRHWLAHVLPESFPDPEDQVNPLRPVLYSLRRHYRLRRIPGTFTVISTMDYETPRSFWEERADHVAWYEIDAPHQTIFQQPHADALGKVLAQVLREAGA
jgi:thioesterase domain-containing protein